LKHVAALSLLQDQQNEVEEARVQDILKHLLVEVPALGKVAHYEYRSTGEVSIIICDVAKFFVKRTVDVRALHSNHDFEDAAHPGGAVVEENTEETGSCHGPIQRHRPIYPKLKYDHKLERNVVSGEDGIGCPKHYSLYGQKGLTGGLMALWCTHCICIGWHCIPEAEGRDDVFSALFTRWPEAPDVVIYDFACALAPYCMLRESKFFKNTKFLIDAFHAAGHTKCSKACFLTNYTGYDLDVNGLNSSAAECGNAGLLRIRKSMSYMREDHAIVFVGVFLSIWNRNQRLNNPRLRRHLRS